MANTDTNTKPAKRGQKARAQQAKQWAQWASEHYDDFAALEREWDKLSAGFAQAAAPDTRDDELVITYSVSLMNWFMATRNWETALAWLNEAITACQASGDDEMLAMMYNRGGLVHSLRGVFGEGFNWYSKALPLFEKLGDRTALATVEGNLGLLALATANRTAQEHLNRAAMLNMQLRDRSHEAQVVEHALVTLLTQGWDAAAALAVSRLKKAASAASQDRAA